MHDGFRGASEEAHALATGSADGKVQFWTPSLEMAVCIDVKALGPLSQMIHSLSWDRINRKVTNVLNVDYYSFVCHLTMRMFQSYSADYCWR